LGKIGKMTFIQQAGVIFSGNNVAKSCANMIKICPGTPEIARVTTAPFLDEMPKLAYPTQYLSNY